MTAPAVACPECGDSFADGFEHCPLDGSRLGQVDALCGRELGGRYFILSRVGVGATGSVYAASDERLHRRVAIKVLDPQIAERPAQLERFRQEVKTLTSLGHEHIVDVSDVQKDGGRLYFAMEYLRGHTLAALLERAGRLELEQVVPIVDQCCRALHAAHERGVVHRDLKPANVFLLGRDGRSDFVKLLDFGVARILYAEGEPPIRAGEARGTPRYLSPEQAEGRPVDGRADQYALGVMMYEMLTGSVPFGGDSYLAILRQHVEAPPRRFDSVRPGLEVPAAVEQVVRKALAKQPQDRYPNASALAVALRDAMHAVHHEQLHAAFRAYNVPAPTAEAARRMASLHPDAYALLESLRHTLAEEQRRQFSEQRDAARELEQRITELEARNRALSAQLAGAHGERAARS